MNAPTALVPLVEASPRMVLVETPRFDQFFLELEREAADVGADVSTEAGRAAIKSMAYRLAKLKTSIDNDGKALTETQRKEIEAVNAQRRVVWDKMEALQKKVRAPLDEWEAQEAARAAKADSIMAGLRRAAEVGFNATSEAISATLTDVRGQVLDAEVLLDSLPVAEKLQAQALETLTAALAAAEAREAQAAELARLRAAEEERLARETAEREARERREQEEAAARAAEEAERERVATAARAAEEAAQRAAQEAADAAERRHQEELAAAQRRADEAEAARLAEIARAETARQAEAAAAAQAAEAQRQREANLEHRRSIHADIKTALIGGPGLTEDQARLVTLALASGTVPHVTVQY